MNTTIDIKCLTGSTVATFGDNNETATAYTNVRKGFDLEKPNVDHFLNNFTFSVSMMREIMVMMDGDKQLEPLNAALLWIKNYPEVYKQWFDGITTKYSKPALPVIEKYLQTI